jgi:hypothetical protein
MTRICGRITITHDFPGDGLIPEIRVKLQRTQQQNDVGQHDGAAIQGHESTGTPFIILPSIILQTQFPRD